MAAKQRQPKWEGKLHATLPTTTAGEAWAVLSRSYCSLHKLLPALADCELVDGVDGRPGCLRRCVGPSKGTVDGGPVGWAEERLLSVDDGGMTFVYEIARSNTGFGRFVTTIRVKPEVEGRGCVLEWSFTGDAMRGGYWTEERLAKFLEVCLVGLAKGVEAAARVAPVEGRLIRSDL